MQHNMIETVMGFVVLLIAGFFLVFAYTGSQYDSNSGYFVKASFGRIDGIQTGSDVRLSGVKVGIVTHIEVDKKTYYANTILGIVPDIKLPKDTSAKIISDGLIGSKYVALEPGGDKAFLNNGDTISSAQGTLILEDMIGQLIFSNKDKDGDKNEGGKEQ